ncbi:MAG: peptide deformylase [Rickettsiales bacterium]
MGRILDIVIHPDPRLKQSSKAVGKVDDAVRQHFDDLIETMLKHDGVGLAGVQVGIMKRLFVVDLRVVAERDGRAALDRFDHIGGVLCFADAEITHKSKEIYSLKQGCISLPGILVDVPRPEKITVKFVDYNNKPQEIEAEGMLSQCVQHENDHTYGKLITDYLPPMKREMQLKKVIKHTKNVASEL